MTAALSEGYILLNRVEFTLNCTESKWVALSATLNLWHRSVAPGDQICVRSHNQSLAKASVTVSSTVGLYNAFFVRVHVCMFSIEGYFWGSNCVRFRAKFEPTSLTQNVLSFFVFVKSKFCCNNVALKWLTCRKRSCRQMWWERDLKFVEIVWGFTNNTFVLIYRPLWRVAKIIFPAILTTNLKLFVVPSQIHIPVIAHHLHHLASASQLCLVGLSLECFFSLLRHCLVCVDMYKRN